MKRVVVCVLGVVIMACTGCSNKYTQDIDTQSVNNQECAYVTDAQNYYSECNIADDGVGYYFTNQKVDGYELYYYDSSAAEAVPLCSKINCKHDDQSCDAYFTNEECLGGFIWYQNNNLFRIEEDIDTGNVYLLSFNRDGSNPTRGNILWNGDNIRYSKYKTIYFRSMVMHKGYLYYTYQLDVNDDVSVYRVKIDGNGEREVLGTIPHSSDIKNFGEIHISNNSDSIFFSVYSTLNDETATKLFLCQYNIEESKFNILISEEGYYDHKYIKDDNGKVIGDTGAGWSGEYDIMDLAFDNDNNMYFYKCFTGEIFKYNLHTKEMKKIYQTEESGNLAFYDNELYLNNYNKIDSSEVTITVIDTDGNLIKEVAPGTPYNYLGDRNYLFSKTQRNSLTYTYSVYNKNTGEWKQILQDKVMK